MLEIYVRVVRDFNDRGMFAIKSVREKLKTDASLDYNYVFSYINTSNNV
jgi:hypothetical protein